MGSAETHCARAGCEPRDCKVCGVNFTPKRPWAAYCSQKCRNDNHAAEVRKEVQRAAAGDLYAALLELVACKDIADWLDKNEENGLAAPGDYHVLAKRKEYNERKPKAWDTARAALAKAGYKEPKP